MSAQPRENNDRPLGPVDLRQVTRLWFPLAASWALMAIEMPLLAAVIGRLPDERLHLAAYGGIAFPIALVVEAPIIMLLAASTALCHDWQSTRYVRSFMRYAAVALTLLHALVAFTPIYDWVAQDLLAANPLVAESGRLGLQILLPWTAAIAYRRFMQGLLIRASLSRAVGIGTVVRLAANASVLIGLATLTELPGIAVGSWAISAGVTVEAFYIGYVVRPTLARLRATAPGSKPPLTASRFAQFYVPLALTPLVTLLLQPLGSAAMNRLPNPIDCLAVWPAVHGLVFLTRSMGFAYNEVVVALAEQPGSRRVLRQFRNRLALGTTLVLLLFASTPLARHWFEGVNDLNPFLAALAGAATALAVPMPGLQAMQSYFTGLLVSARKTRGITEAVLLFFLVAASSLAICVKLGSLRDPGLLFAVASFTLASVVQTLWLAWRVRRAGLAGDAVAATAS